MLKSLRLRTILYLTFALISALAILPLTHGAWQAASNYREAKAVESFAAAEGAFIGGAYNILMERLYANNAYAAAVPVPGNVRGEIDTYRRGAVSGLNHGIGVIRTLTFNNRDKLVGDYDAAARTVEQLRPQIDAALAKPGSERDPQLIKDFFPAMTKLAATAEALWIAVVNDQTLDQGIQQRYVLIKQMGWLMRNTAGIERSDVSGAIGQAKPVSAEIQAKIKGIRAKVDGYWGLAKEAAADPRIDGIVRAALDSANREYFGNFRKLHDDMVKLGDEGKPYPMTVADFVPLTTAQMGTLLDIMYKAGEASVKDAGKEADSALMTMVINILLLLLAVIVTVVALVLVTTRVIRPIQATQQTVAALAQGDNAVAVHYTDNKDEIGEMARAVAVFKQNAEEKIALESRQQAERVRFETERKEQEQRFESVIGDVVMAAAQGDLSRRVETRGLDGVLLRVGEAVNVFVIKTDEVMREVGGVTEKMAQGDLRVRVPGNFSGRFSTLSSAINAMGDRLRDIAGQLNTSASTISAASAEISSGSQNLSQRTESQAASIEETAASMHEITTTVKQNADNAQAANQLATAARDTAEKGGSVVADAVTAVTQIESSAQKISDIVGLIDEIAFQTNLLALNASVEAARAGEAGKGFAVVAQEVRALAQRSANASKDIKALINESNAQVKTGAALVNQTGSSLNDIVTAIKKVSDIVAEIASASREQATGLEQVNTAVGQMDEMTQRNGALVEETSASAQALADQGQQLAELVGFFKLGGTRELPLVAE